MYLSQSLPVEQITESLCSVSLNYPLTSGLTAELKHVLEIEGREGREGVCVCVWRRESVCGGGEEAADFKWRIVQAKV